MVDEPSKTSVSGFSSSTYGAVETRRVMLLAMQKPEFQSSASSLTKGNSARTMSAVPSALALSTTHTLISP